VAFIGLHQIVMKILPT